MKLSILFEPAGCTPEQASARFVGALRYSLLGALDHAALPPEIGRELLRLIARLELARASDKETPAVRRASLEQQRNCDGSQTVPKPERSAQP
jgi:hypothetical protein